MPVFFPTRFFWRCRLLPILLLPLRTAAQLFPAAAPPDTLRQVLNPAEVVARRATHRDPVPYSEWVRPALAPVYAGQELPTLLTQLPAVTSTTDGGAPFGYTYFRLRGLDQTRLNATLDGIPLNEPEDQGAYFVNLPGFADDLASVQVQRGVGLGNGTGTAPFGGALNFVTSRPEAPAPRFVGLLSGGAFGTARASATYRTGATASGWAASARLTGQRTDGYRTGAFYRGFGGSASVSWTGTRLAVRLLTLAGDARNGMAYLAAAEADIRQNRRFNPLSGAETDHFRQALTALTVRYATGARSEWTTTAYGNFVRGQYGVAFAPDPAIFDFAVRGTWGGALTTWRYAGPRLEAEAGLHAYTYRRRHLLFPDAAPAAPFYENAGRKREGSAFARLAWQPWAGGPRLSGDVNVRRATFRYQPDAAAELTPLAVTWTFINPKIGFTQAVGAGGQLFAAVGRVRREPTRTDMLAGFDNLDQLNADLVVPLTRVRPETLTDFEAGARWQHPTRTRHLALTAYAMEFRNEIAALGPLSYIGLPLRKNVGRSWRRGLELEGALAPSPWVLLTGNVAYQRAGLLEYFDDAQGVNYHRVVPLLSPAFTGAAGVTFRLNRSFVKGLDGVARDRRRSDGAPRSSLLLHVGGQGRSASFLTNTQDPALRLPGAVFVEAALSWERGPLMISLVGQNLANARYTTGGYATGPVANYFVAPPPHAYLNARFTLP